ncbi:metal ABC transporter substrate-binding protein [Thiohalorhabdus sp. Cl-TMA]|uniref:Metal ABC transporter substrate-binding protein n=1 Tax=Thiohalorhabdus methylotrophus TaxID=3242694 RepID=A0ABV4TQ98_9GAMM
MQLGPRLLARFAAILAWLPAAATAASLDLVATIPPYAMTARAVAGGAAEVHVLVQRGQDPHHFEPSIAEMARIQAADLVIRNGIGQQRVEGYLTEAVSSGQLFTVSETVSFDAIRDERGAVNGHIWLEPEVMIRAARALAERLGELLPDRAEAFAANGERFIAAIRTADRKADALLSGLPVRKVVTYHPAFEYFFRHYGLEVAGTYLDLAGNEPAPRKIRDLLATIRRAGIPAVFREPQLPESAVRALAREAGVRVAVLDPLGFDPAISGYPELIRYNARQVHDAYTR